MSYVLLTVVICPTLTDPTNGRVITGTGGSTYQAEAFYICDTGYAPTPSNDDGRFCGADGEWSGVETTCQRELACNGVIIMLINGIVGSQDYNYTVAATK